MFVERFREVVRRQPGAVAVEEGDLRLSYGELDARARGVAARLARAGLGREAVVGLGLRKSADYLIGLLGVWYVGAAFLPLDPDLPGARLQFMLDDAAARGVLTRAADAAPFRSLNGPALLDLDECRETAPDERIDPARGAADDLAYVIYTSGSTGVPKGVAVTHRGIVNLIDGQIPAFGLTDTSRVLWLLSTSFDASVSDIGTALLAGATLCIECGSAVETAADLLRTVARRGITHLDLPPALLAILDPEAAPACLETLIIGGEPCPPEAVRRWARQRRVINVYGPTEATVCSSLCRCDPGTWSRPLLGQPLPNVVYRVLDEDRKPVAEGGSGELYIGGPGLARGYVGRPDLDAARFLRINGERMYRTGDRVVRHPDGEFEFLGRVDRQVKLRGQLISPEEVESRLLSLPEVGQAAVIKRRLGGGEALVAFVVPAGETRELDEDGMRAHLRGHLPGWMLPQHYVSLAALPVTRTGKTDFAALALLDLETAVTSERVAPRDPVEAALLAVWQRVLERDDFGVTDDFFALGGDSLGVLRLVAAAEAHGIPCPPGLLMVRRTVRGVIEGTRTSPPAVTEGMSATDLRRELEPYQSELRALAKGRSGGVPVRSPRRILLTGATGFLGSRLLHELLQQTAAEVVCLVRADTPAAGLTRCVRAVEAHGLSVGAAERERLRVVCGDLAEVRFGLSDKQWCWLAAGMEAVYHCGAWVHLVYPFETLRATNLGGTAEVLRLVRTGRPKHVHYVSTLSVFVATDRNAGPLHEDDDLSQTAVVYGGYAQSKWAAEVLVRECLDPGDPVSIYRLGLITGDTRTGYVPRHDQLSLFLRGLAELGCYPAELGDRLRVDITPVDYAAAALMQLSRRAPLSPRETFHIASPRGATLGALAQAVRRAGVLLEEVSHGEWQRRWAALGSDRRSEAVSTACVSLCRGLGDTAGFARQRTLDLFQATDTEFGREHTRAGLAESGLQCPEATSELLDLYVQCALRAGEPL